MEKLYSTEVINGDLRLKLPVGFRFRPTDEELIVHYLARKVLALPLPAPAVSDLDVFRSEPSDLPGDLKERRHFFSRINSRAKRNLHGSDVSRRVVASGSGYWRPVGREKRIVSGSDSNRPIGVRKSFVFREKIRGGSGVVKKQWIMHELRLVGLRRPLCSTLSDNLAMPRSEEHGEWAVYRVFQKKRKPKRHRCKELVCSNIATEMDFIGEEDTAATRWSDPPPPSSPCSSLTMEHDSPFGVLLVDQDEITSFR